MPFLRQKEVINSLIWPNDLDEQVENLIRKGKTVQSNNLCPQTVEIRQRLKRPERVEQLIRKELGEF